MSTVFVYCSSFTLQRVRHNLFFPVAISEYWVLTPMAFLLSVFIGGPSGLWKAFLGVVDLVSEDVPFPISRPVREFVDAVWYSQVIRQCWLRASPSFLHIGTRQRSTGKMLVAWDGFRTKVRLVMCYVYQSDRCLRRSEIVSSFWLLRFFHRSTLRISRRAVWSWVTRKRLCNWRR